MRENIKQILMRRDGMSSVEAEELIEEATKQFILYLEDRDLYTAEEICAMFLGLEPDYIDEII